MMSQVIEEGLTIMLTGMGVVFSFLIILIMAMHVMSGAVKILNKFFPEAEPEQKVSKPKRQGKDDEEIAIAIAIAVRSM